MNDGYLSLLLIVVSLILFASGWKDVLIRGITQPSLLLFFVSWLAIWGRNIQWGTLSFSGCVGVLTAVWLWGMIRTRGWLLRLHLLSISLLIGSILFFLKETMHWMPALLVRYSALSSAMLAGGIAAALLRLPVMQFAALALGMLLGESMFVYSHKAQGMAVLGSAAFQDDWWLTLFAVRGISLLLEGMRSAMRKAFRFVRETLRVRKE